MTGVILDVEAPRSPPSRDQAGTYTSGKVLSFTVKTSEKVNVTGTPYIGITVGPKHLRRPRTFPEQGRTSSRSTTPSPAATMARSPSNP